MAVRMRVHSVGAGKTPDIRPLTYTGTDIVIGSVLVYSSGNVALAGADPALIAGVSLNAYATQPGYDAANSPATITGRAAKVSVVIPNATTIFLATLTTSSATTVVPAQSNVGVQYGITAYSGIWTIDTGKTGADARVEVVGFDTTVYGGVVFFKFLTSHISSD